jgi:hypothetical protein
VQFDRTITTEPHQLQAYITAHREPHIFSWEKKSGSSSVAKFSIFVTDDESFARARRRLSGRRLRRGQEEGGGETEDVQAAHPGRRPQR